jgi:hypothetical protein
VPDRSISARICVTAARGTVLGVYQPNPWSHGSGTIV